MIRIVLAEHSAAFLTFSIPLPLFHLFLMCFGCGIFNAFGNFLLYSPFRFYVCVCISLFYFFFNLSVLLCQFKFYYHFVNALTHHITQYFLVNWVFFRIILFLHFFENTKLIQFTAKQYNLFYWCSCSLIFACFAYQFQKFLMCTNIHWVLILCFYKIDYIRFHHHALRFLVISFGRA